MESKLLKLPSLIIKKPIYKDLNINHTFCTSIFVASSLLRMVRGQTMSHGRVAAVALQRQVPPTRLTCNLPPSNSIRRFWMDWNLSTI